MNCACATTGFRFPWERLSQRVIDFENSGRVPKGFQPAAIAQWQLLTNDSQKLPDGNIEKNYARFWKIVETFDAVIEFDFTAKLTQISGKRVRNLLRATAGDRPAHRVSRKAQHQCEC